MEICCYWSKLFLFLPFLLWEYILFKIKSVGQFASVIFQVVNAPGVARAVLKTFFLFIHRLIDWLITWSFRSQSSKHCWSLTLRAGELKCWENVHPKPYVRVTCHMSCVICHVTGVMCQVSHIILTAYFATKVNSPQNIVTG